ncbi:glutamate synthase large subunit [Caenibacillus caldisaponilyticus]|uniref:glutamate synthase large subunit n=1 Tax=Caenibacillus caldisaponilyticus TaxID=1674942 RepID=UPI000988754F|nr:glutamate synthase large subunit [Caenibacillus caldisaponilyticus]
MKPRGLYHPAYEHDACGIGFVAQIDGTRSRAIVDQSLHLLERLEHRAGFANGTGDGAGILTEIPDDLLRQSVPFDLPAFGDYAVGMVFLPDSERLETLIIEAFEHEAQRLALGVIGWRDVPVDAAVLGPAAAKTKPRIKQVFIGKQDEADERTFDRRLYVLRRGIEKRFASDPGVYVASLSSRTIVYKGLLRPAELPVFYADLANPAYRSAFGLVHSRFSTNTFPTWERAHPYRTLIHNGEINTLKGNIHAMKSRERLLNTDVFGVPADALIPIINEAGSDSAALDNVLEFLLLSGVHPAHAAMMLVPEPWENDPMDPDVKAFYEYHSALMEPWDGPMAVAFTDGRFIAAGLDRNGLRPARYVVTTDGRLVFSSEFGALDVQPEEIESKRHLKAGEWLFIDLEAGRIVPDEELKRRCATAYPYRKWVEENVIDLRPERSETPADKEGEEAPDLSMANGNEAGRSHDAGRLNEASESGARPVQFDADTSNGRESVTSELFMRQKLFGYTYEEVHKSIKPMAESGKEPVASMGMDAPVAVLSERPQLLYNYFKQWFAQVTNPPIDAIREKGITSTLTWLGPTGDLLQPGPENVRRIKLASPLLDDALFRRLQAVPGFKACRLDAVFSADDEHQLEKALSALFNQAEEAVAAGAALLILSDRSTTANQAPIPMLLAISGLHHHFMRRGIRTKVSLIADTGEARDSHHVAALIGYGADAVYPYLAIESVRRLVRDGHIEGLSEEQAVRNYLKALIDGVVKIMSKLGISTVQSYRGAQTFDALGISEEVIDRYFTGTPSPIGGLSLADIARETLSRFRAAFRSDGKAAALDSGSVLQWRNGGEYHRVNPKTVYLLQQAVRRNDPDLYRQFCEAADQEEAVNIRNLFTIESGRPPVPLEEVEPAEAILKRFKTGAMSYGALSQEAHEALAIAMNRIGGKSNSGEGGEDPRRYRPDENGDSRRSAIKQVASGRFGVTSLYLAEADEIQIKMAQGAKPGEGGQLPAEKVYPWIAEVRGSTPGVGLISPPPHHDIYSIEDLAQLIYDLKQANPKARISVKLTAKSGVGTIAAGVAKANADVILISGYDGGTGAAARTSIQHAGLPWELGLAEAHQTLLLNGLRDRVTLEADGKLLTGRDVIVAACLGAEEYGFSTAPLVALGCVMMRVCHKDTCPVGIATQNPELRQRMAGEPEHVVNYMRFVAEDVRQWLAALGYRSLDELIGATHLLKPGEPVRMNWKAKRLDFSKLLSAPSELEGDVRRKAAAPHPPREASFDAKVLLPAAKPALERGETVHLRTVLKNTDRAVGTRLGHEVSAAHGENGLPDGAVTAEFSGSAGQSFGAFVPKGLTFILNGDANDYVGKGLSGGRLVIKPPAETPRPQGEAIIGNVAFYGATSGESYIRGAAGARFAVRNSGACLVVEGVGDHGCEYMTGGTVVILGPIGKNFAAGMSGGVAYLWPDGNPYEVMDRVNREMVVLEALNDEQEIRNVRSLVEQHWKWTDSPRARKILERWETCAARFIKVVPIEYKKMTMRIAELLAEGHDEPQAKWLAFQMLKSGADRPESKRPVTSLQGV